ncbi:MAG: periplasmic heavy metal sensor [Tabrizicola sp.]
MAKPAEGTGASRWIKIALATSVALNLTVAGLALGAWVREGPPRDRMPRELSFGPFSEALDAHDRRAIRKALQDRAPGFREARAAAREEFAALLVALRTSPFDADAMQAALAAIEMRMADRLALGRELIAKRLLEMSDAQRRAFADRLEKSLRRRSGN